MGKSSWVFTKDGAGSWTGPFESYSGSAGPVSGGYFQSPGGGGYRGINLGAGKGPPGAGATVTNYGLWF
jgi:hypothetical protein